MRIRLIAAAIFTAASLMFGPAAIASDITPPPGPKDLTWAELSELKKGASVPLSSGALQDRVATQSCTVNMGDIYFRRSGEEYPNGAIGLKPLLRCTVVMPYIAMSTTLYKKVWWGLQFQTGPVATSGSFVQQIQSKNILQPCMNRKYSTNFYAITTSNMTFPGGSVSTGSAFQEATLDCATF